MKKGEKSFRKFRKGPVFFAVAFLLLSLAGLFFVYKKIGDNKIAAALTIAEWRAEYQKRQEIRTLNIFLENVREEREALDRHFARGSNVVPFLDSLEELGKLVGGRAQVLSVETPGEGKDLVVTLRTEGSFESVYKFLELLENSPYPLLFMNLDMSRLGEEGINANWEGLFKIKLLTFIP